jgi:type IV pilus assembly protein PilA
MEFQIVALYITSNPKKHRNCEGFTLIELLVVVIIIGILSAIALPNLLGQTGKARETEAKNNLSSIGVSQQTYFFEHGTFADNLAKLDVSFQSNYYNFLTPTLVNANAVKHQAISNSPDPRATNTRNYGLGVYYDNSSKFSVILCQSLTPGEQAEAPNASTDSCISGTKIQ